MKKRQMIFVPQVNPNSFVFFYEMGSGGSSWSIRDYSIPHWVKKYGPSDFHWSADDIRRMAEQAFDAPTHPTEDLDFWHRHTQDCNQRLGSSGQAKASAAAPKDGVMVVPPAAKAAVSVAASQPVLNLDRLQDTSKGRKAQDMERILHSPNSEDWVTWNFFQILQTQYPSGWFGHIVAAARRRNPELVFPFDDCSLPTLKLWAAVCAPRLYEMQSRARMRTSGNPAWVARAEMPDPVEGSSEIDIVLDHEKYLLYVEAKLGSDISLSTSHDPERNQIARNIDCVIEQAGPRSPLFWMLVRDEDPSRAYVQLMRSYRRDPGLLAAALPHRDPETLRRLAQNLTILLWSDFAELTCCPGTDLEANAVKHELERRIMVPVTV
jgi:hypothetical protein